MDSDIMLRSEVMFPGDRRVVIDNEKLLKHLNPMLKSYGKKYAPFTTPNLCIVGLDVIRDCILEGVIGVEDAQVFSTNNLLPGCSVVVTGSTSGILFLQQPISL